MSLSGRGRAWPCGDDVALFSVSFGRSLRGHRFELTLSDILQIDDDVHAHCPSSPPFPADIVRDWGPEVPMLHSAVFKLLKIAADIEGSNDPGSLTRLATHADESQASDIMSAHSEESSSSEPAAPVSSSNWQQSQ